MVKKTFNKGVLIMDVSIFFSVLTSIVVFILLIWVRKYFNFENQHLLFLPAPVVILLRSTIPWFFTGLLTSHLGWLLTGLIVGIIFLWIYNAFPIKH